MNNLPRESASGDINAGPKKNFLTRVPDGRKFPVWDLLESKVVMSENPAKTHSPVNSPRQVLFASLIGTTIEFFDFYIYATAAVLVFPRLFFPATDPASATLASLATICIVTARKPIRLNISSAARITRL